MTTVMTVRGPVPVDELGITLPHEHLVCNAVRLDGDLILDDVDLSTIEATRFRASGGATVVEVSSQGLGRDPLALKRIAEETGLNVVMGCGWYHERVYQPELSRQTANDLAGQMVRDLLVGVGDTGVRAGIIGEVGCAGDVVSPIEERVLRAAARAHTQTGRSIITHGDFSPIGLAQLDIFAEEGVDPRRVIVSHCDSCPQPDYHAEVGRRGAFIEFDLVRGTSEWETDRHLRWIRSLWDQGFGHQVLLSQDVCKPRHLHAYGGFGYDHILVEFVPRLISAGFSQEQIDIMLIANPAAALSGCRI